jgi:hypothetical protein
MQSVQHTPVLPMVTGRDTAPFDEAGVSAGLYFAAGHRWK